MEKKIIFFFSLFKQKMNFKKQKLSEIYSTPSPELADDDLSFLRSMIEKPPTPNDPIDYDFLKNELSKRKPIPEKKKKGIELIDYQVKKPTRTPHYLRSRSVTTQNPIIENKNQVSVVTMGSSSKPGILTEEELENTHNNQNKTDIKKSKNYVAWKYIGVMAGELGVISAKVNANQSSNLIQREFANLPYAAESYKRIPPKSSPKPKIHPRDLFSISIDPESKEIQKQKAICALKQQETFSKKQPKNDTKLYIETESKLIPLVVSRLDNKNFV